MRMRYHCIMSAILLAAGNMAFAQDGAKPTGEAMLVFIGTGTGAQSQSKGIYVLRFDSGSGKLGEPKLAAESARSTFIAIHPNRRWLYAVTEIADAGGAKSGGVAAFEIDGGSGMLKKLNEQPSGGMGPCYVAIDPSGKCAMVANYGSGSVAAIAIDQSTGMLASANSVIQHEGKGADPKRQTGPHAHSINPDPSGKFAIACDLGIDRVDVYRLDPATAKLTANDPNGVTLTPGSGPRHLVFSKDGKFLYVVNELANTVTVLAWDGERGSLSEVQTVPTLPADFKGTDTASEIAVGPSGRFVYSANRGHDSIAIFARDAASGKLEPRGHVLCGGSWPRGFRIDPTGKFMLVTNEKSSTVVEFRIDQESGALTPSGEVVSVPTPMCAKFLDASR